MSANLENVKKAVGITDTNLDNTIQQWFDDVVGFLKDAGVSEANITNGIVARGISDLWNYGAGEGKLSDYFKMRATQLALKGSGKNG